MVYAPNVSRACSTRDEHGQRTFGPLYLKFDVLVSHREHHYCEAVKFDTDFANAVERNDDHVSEVDLLPHDFVGGRVPVESLEIQLGYYSSFLRTAVERNSKDGFRFAHLLFVATFSTLLYLGDSNGIRPVRNLPKVIYFGAPTQPEVRHATF